MILNAALNARNMSNDSVNYKSENKETTAIVALRENGLNSSLNTIEE